MKPHRFKQGNSWGWIFGLMQNGCIDFRFACTDLPAIRKGAMKPNANGRVYDYEALRQAIANSYRVPVSVLMGEINHSQEGAMRESAFQEDASKMTKAQLLEHVVKQRLQAREIAERSERRLRVINEVDIIIEDLDNIDPLPWRLKDIVCTRLRALCREGKSHTKPGA